MAISKKKKIVKKKIAVPARNATHSVAGGKKTVKTVKRKTAVQKPRRPKGSGSRPKASGKISPLELERSKKNPIIEPEDNVYWESKATFNPSAIHHDGKVHVIYRAIGDSDISVLGYAKSDDGCFFDKRSKEMAYYHRGKQTWWSQ